MEDSRREQIIEMLLKQIPPKVIAYDLKVSTRDISVIKKEYTETIVRRRFRQLSLFEKD